MTLEEFARATGGDWGRLGRKLVKLWDCPPWFDEEDAAQEMALAAFVWVSGGAVDSRYDAVTGQHRGGRASTPFDPSLGVDLGRFVRFRSFKNAKLAAHRARAAGFRGLRGGNLRDRLASRYDRAASSLVREGAESDAVTVLDQQSTPATQEDELLLAEKVAEVYDLLEDDADRAVLAALFAERDRALAAKRIYDDVDTRIDLRIGSEEQARRIVAKSTKRIARALSAA